MIPQQQDPSERQKPYGERDAKEDDFKVKMILLAFLVAGIIAASVWR